MIYEPGTLKAIGYKDGLKVLEDTFLGVGNGNPGSHEPDTVPVRRAFNGLCQLLVRPTGAGEIHIKATSPGVLAQILTIGVIK